MLFSRPRQTGGESARDGVGFEVNPDDWQGSGRLLCCHHRSWPDRYKHINLEPDQLCREARECLRLSLRPAGFDLDRLAVDVTKVAQAVAEARHAYGAAGQKSGMQKAD
jgi:hypothetical protein